MAPTARLIVMSGLPGSGKSTLAEKIAASLKAPILSVDPIESAIIAAGIAKGFETGYAAYLVAETLAKEQLKLGGAVVIDAVNAEAEAKQVWLDCARELRIPLAVLECMLADTELHQRRLAARVRNLHGFDEITWDQVQERRKAYTPWPTAICTIDMSADLDDNLQTALQFIARQT